MDSLTDFFLDNEKKTNDLLVTALFFCAVLCVLLVATCLAGFFPDINSSTVIPISLFDFIFILFLIPLMKNKRDSNVTKYLVICAISLMILSIAVIPNIRVYLTFLIPPLLASFYMNEHFTFFSCIVSGFMYLLSIGARCIFEGDDTFLTQTRWEYFLSFGIGGLVEYCVYCFILFYLTRTTYQSLMHSYLRRKRLNQIHNLILDGFANIVESKDKSTAEHISRTSRYVELICEKLRDKGLFPDQVNDTTIPVMIRAAPFHDLGKISVPDDILNKSSKLDSQEWTVIKHHPTDGALFIQHNFVVLNDDLFTKIASEMALCHHERVDGTGYPFKLVGDEIPVCARIMAAADIFDALVSERAYKKAYSIDEAYSVLRELSGSTLDPAIVECMFDAREEVELTMRGSDV